MSRRLDPEIKELRSTMRYFGSKRLPGWVLCHNHVTHTPAFKYGENGFRVFYMPSIKTVAEGWLRCPCGWRPDLGVHYANPDYVASLTK